jgi:homoserine O-acetyltransferase
VSYLTRACIFGLSCLASACGPGQQRARLGDLRLESGAVIHDCHLGYRTFGSLDAARSNAVLVLTWSMGSSGDLVRQIGPGKLVDSARYFVIVADALGNGVSSSPSNSRRQPGLAFPAFTVRDLVESQHRLVTEVFRLTHLHAIVGVSFGGMQAFAWSTAHPGFASKIVSITGTPRSTPEDRDRWQRWIVNMDAPSWRRAGRRLAKLEPRGAFAELALDEHDYARQAQAIIGHDVATAFDGDLTRAAQAVRARMLVVVSPTDDVVTPAPARAFASAAGAELLELDGRCGHAAPSCERATLWPAIDRFLR